MSDDERPSYCIGCGDFCDGKGINLWRHSNAGLRKMARFLGGKEAEIFAKEFGFPLSDRVKERIGSK